MVTVVRGAFKGWLGSEGLHTHRAGFHALCGTKKLGVYSWNLTRRRRTVRWWWDSPVSASLRPTLDWVRLIKCILKNPNHGPFNVWASHVPTHAGKHTHTHTQVNAWTHAHRHTQVNAWTHTHRHTHTPQREATPHLVVTQL